MTDHGHTDRLCLQVQIRARPLQDCRSRKHLSTRCSTMRCPIIASYVVSIVSVRGCSNYGTLQHSHIVPSLKASHKLKDPCLRGHIDGSRARPEYQGDVAWLEKGKIGPNRYLCINARTWTLGHGCEVPLKVGSVHAHLQQRSPSIPCAEHRTHIHAEYMLRCDWQPIQRR